MIRLAIVVEGRTEEEFVNRVIAPHLWARGVDPTPILIGGGGNVTVDRLASEIADLFWSFKRVTSLVDFYGFRDKGDASRTELEALTTSAAPISRAARDLVTQQPRAGYREVAQESPC